MSGLLLPDALFLPVGRGTLLLPEQERQLLGGLGTLTSQLCRVFDAVSTELRRLLGVRADLPYRLPHPWTLLIEGECAAWPLLALSDPPPLSAGVAAHLVRHLSTSHQAMPLVQARSGAGERTGDQAAALTAALAGQGAVTWGMLLCAMTAVQAQHLMLSHWGVLSAFMGLNPGLKVVAARQLWQGVSDDPALARNAASLAEAALWAVLTPLHNGQRRPAREQVMALAQRLKTLPAHAQVGNLPGVQQLNALLTEQLPLLSDPARAQLIQNWHAGRDSGGADPSIGVPVIRQAGQTAYWLLLRHQLHFMTCTAWPGQDVQLHAWNWTWTGRDVPDR